MLPTLVPTMLRVIALMCAFPKLCPLCCRPCTSCMPWGAMPRATSGSTALWSCCARSGARRCKLLHASAMACRGSRITLLSACLLGVHHPTHPLIPFPDPACCQACPSRLPCSPALPCPACLPASRAALPCPEQTFLVDFAALSLIDVDRAWFKAKAGLDYDSTDRQSAFGGRAGGRAGVGVRLGWWVACWAGCQCVAVRSCVVSCCCRRR